MNMPVLQDAEWPQIPVNNALWQEVAPARTGGQIAERLYVFDRQDLASLHWQRRENPVFSGWRGGSRHSREPAPNWRMALKRSVTLCERFFLFPVRFPT